MSINKIPNSWVLTKLGDAFIRISNGCSATQYQEQNGLPITRIETISNANIDLNKVRYNNDLTKNEIDKYQLIEGDILFSHINSDSHLGKTAIFHNINKIVIHGINLLLLRPSHNINPFFLNYLFNHLRYTGAFIKIAQHAVNQSSINQAKLKEVEIPLPPLREQHRIVSKLEELFSQLDIAVSEMKRAKEQIKTYKQSVLKYAFEGKLTIDSSQLKIDNETGLPEGWKWVKLYHVCSKIQDGSHFSPQEQFTEPEKDKYKYITAKNIRNNFMDFRKVTYVNEEFHKSIFSRCNPEYGDVLLTKDGINTGDVCINTIKEPISLLSSVCLIKAIPEKVKSKFIVYFFQSNIGNRNLIGDMTGTAIKRIVLKKIKETNIIVPPIIQQEQIVTEIETRFSEAENLDKTIDVGLKQAESLRQSILKKAFEGRLVPQDPNDESAEKLLDRIKTENLLNKKKEKK